MSHGGPRKGAGRKSKTNEERVRSLSINALKSIYGSEEKAFEQIAEKAKDSFPHLKLLFEYAYGKPKQSNNLVVQVEQPLFPESPKHKEKEHSDEVQKLNLRTH